MDMFSISGKCQYEAQFKSSSVLPISKAFVTSDKFMLLYIKVLELICQVKFLKSTMPCICSKIDYKSLTVIKVVPQLFHV